ncbi:MAG: hypothetical protein PVJ38_02675 [Candidatus Bathyarchaeota archaeon]|jgi:hypothetical protein
MPELTFELTPAEKKPQRRYRKGSKYDPVLDAFLESEHRLVEVSVEGKEANYLRTQLKKRIDAREIEGIDASVVNNVCYLERK